MPSANMSMLQGSFTSDGNTRTINLPFTPSRFELYNQTQWGSTSAEEDVKRAWWFEGFSDNTALTVKNEGATPTDESIPLSAGGFRLIDPSSLGAPLVDTAVTGATKATPVVVTMSASHDLITGDRVLFSDTTGMLQITDMIWQVTSVSASTFSITAPGSTFSTAATAGFVRRAFASEYQPQKVYVQGISKASNAVITTTYDHGYSVNETVTMHVPEFWGMTEMEGLVGRISSVTSNTFTININSSGFTTFTFPTSTQTSAGIGTAHAVNIGIEQSNLLTDSIINESRRGMFLGTNLVGKNNDIIFWTAWSAEGNNIVV